MKEIEFPQPMFEHPEPGVRYYFASENNVAGSYLWYDDSVDKSILNGGNCAEQQAAAIRAICK